MEWSMTVSGESLRRSLFAVGLFIAPALTLLIHALATGGLGRALIDVYGTDEVPPPMPFGRALIDVHRSDELPPPMPFGK